MHTILTEQLIAGNTFLKNYIPRRSKHSRIQRFEKDIEDANTTNNVWKIKKAVQLASD
jgi:hypothetical protein